MTYEKQLKQLQSETTKLLNLYRTEQNVFSTDYIDQLERNINHDFDAMQQIDVDITRLDNKLAIEICQGVLRKVDAELKDNYYHDGIYKIGAAVHNLLNNLIEFNE